MKATVKSQSDPSAVGWTFLTNHGHVLLCLVEDPEVRMREVALRVGITERAVQRIIAELEEAGYIGRQREGRTNRYVVNEDRFLRHPVEGHCTIADLARMVVGKRQRPGPRRKGRA